MSVLLTEALKWVGKLHDGPDVPRMAREIAQVFPDLSSYCAGATNSTAWCGIFQAWLLSKYKIRPPHGDGGVGGFMYVDAWAKVNWGGTRIEPGQEQPGDIICLSSPHHITTLKAVEGARYRCVGGNQSDGVTEATYAKSGLMAILRPPEAVAIGVNPGTGTALRPLVKMGDVNATVSELQVLLGVAVDGEFGEDTDAAVRAFQAAHGLEVDGEVGDDTWAALASSPAKPAPVASDVPHAAEYADYWRRMTIMPDRASELDTIARKLIGNKSRYQAAVAGTKVPWFFIAVIHQRESSANFSKNIHNGEALNKVTSLVPAGRGPFNSFEDSVNDWIALKGLNKIAAWPVERFAYQCELNNGMGYRTKGVPSAYLWSFSNIYRGGKYIADHVWSATAMDAQCGTMPMLKQMMALDASIAVTAPPEKKPMPEPITLPTKPGEPKQIDWSKVEAWGERIEKLGDTLDRFAERMQGKEHTAPPAAPGLTIGGLGSKLVKVLPILGLQGTAWGTAITIAAQALGWLGSAAPIGGTPTTGVISAGLIGTALSSIAAMLNRLVKGSAAPPVDPTKTT